MSELFLATKKKKREEMVMSMKGAHWCFCKAALRKDELNRTFVSVTAILLCNARDGRTQTVFVLPTDDYPVNITHGSRDSEVFVIEGTNGLLVLTAGIILICSIDIAGVLMLELDAPMSQ